MNSEIIKLMNYSHIPPSPKNGAEGGRIKFLPLEIEERNRTQQRGK